MAQTGGILVGEAHDFSRLVILAKLSRVDFTDVAVPGDQLVYEAVLTELRTEGSAVEAKALVNGRPLATAEIVYFHVDRSGTDDEQHNRYNTYKQELIQILGVPARQQHVPVSHGSCPT
jgi:3-hydroxyacyl-[acyl-carrier-protein] dehydratase